MFLLETDTSGGVRESVLAQQQEDSQIWPVAYASWALQQSDKYYGISELEALAVEWAIKHFDLTSTAINAKSTLIIKHYSIAEHTAAVRKITTVGMAVQELILEILYCSGKKNTNVD